MIQAKSKQNPKKQFNAKIAAIGLCSALAIGGIALPATPSFAEAVRVQAPQAVNFADVVEAVSPAVVSVRVKGKSGTGGARQSRSFGFDSLPDDHPLKRFFQDRGGSREFGKRERRGKKFRGNRRTSSQGSGFFVSKDGYIVTNNHVISGGSEFTVVTTDGTELDAKLIGTDPKTDLAVLKVKPTTEFTYVSFSKEKSRVGEWVVAVGNPFGLGGTVTAGIVSANGRDIGSGPYDDFIQIDAAVNKGNSGGPAFNLSGEVIGVNTAIFSPSGGNVGIAFAISADTAQNVVDDLIKNGSVTRGWLGVQIQPVSKDIAESLGLQKARGALIADVTSDSPASKAGLKTGDVILDVNGKAVKGPKGLSRLIASYEPSEIAEVVVFRNGERQRIDVKLGTLPGQPIKVAAETDDQNYRNGQVVEFEEFGLAIAPSSDGVVIADIMEDSPALEKGLRAGDVIVSVNGTEVASVNAVGQAVARALEDDRKAILFQIKSGERNRFIALPVGQG